jgi:hypothetical protein
MHIEELTKINKNNKALTEWSEEKKTEQVLLSKCAFQVGINMDL